MPRTTSSMLSVPAALLVAFAMVVPANAQTPPASQAADPLAADLVREWDAQKNRMVALAEAMPEDKYEFKATPEQRTFGEQLLHLAEAHVAMLKPLDAAGKVPPPALSKSHARADVVRSVAAAYDYGRAVLGTLDGRAHQSAGQRTPAATFLRAMNNAMNHYGQCVVYLRLNGIVPPASRR